MKKLIIFDLDGTLNKIENYAVPSMLSSLRDLGIEGFTEEDVKKTFGAKDEDTEALFFGSRAKELTPVFWKRVNEYVEGPLRDSYATYEGTEKMLQWLKNEGYMTAVCSNSSMDYITKTVERLGIREYIDELQETVPGAKKQDSLKLLLDRVSPDEALMVGDRYFDKAAADMNHIPFAACRYGYGDDKEFEGAEVYLNTPMDLILYLWRKDKKPCRLLALDLDGTLTNSQKEITPHTKDVLMKMQEAGVRIILASGRPVYGIMPIAEQLQLNQYGGYILAFNGGRIIDCKTGDILFSKDLPADVPAKLMAQARKYNTAIVTYENADLITEMPNDVYVNKEAFINKMNVKCVDDFASYVDFPVNKCILMAEGDYLAEVEPKVKAAFGDELSIYRSEPFFLEVMAKNIDKAESLGKLLEILGLDREVLVACGDGHNDCSMIQFAGLGVCMSNGQPPVKEAADYIAPSNDEDGVAYVVEHIVL